MKVEWRRKKLEQNFVEEERVDVEVVVEVEESHEVLCDGEQHDQKARNFDDTHFRSKIYFEFPKYMRKKSSIQ